MPFWKKKCEDPWDRKPEEKKPAPIPDWYRSEEKPEPADCPWCGQPMVAGTLYGRSRAGAGVGSLQWLEGGYRSWLEMQTYMALTAENAIVPDPAIDVRKEPVWRDEFGTHIFEAAGEPWEIPVVRRQMENAGTCCFVARMDGLPVGMIYGHVNGENVCRIDYLLTATAFRGRGVGRALTHAFVEHVKRTGVDCVLWPDGDTPRRIYEEAGFRFVETCFAGRASWRGNAQES